MDSIARRIPHCANPECGDEFDGTQLDGQRFCDECAGKLCKICDNEVPFTIDDRACLTCIETREICGKCCEPKERGMICEECFPNAAAQNAITREAKC